MREDNSLALYMEHRYELQHAGTKTPSLISRGNIAVPSHAAVTDAREYLTIAH